MVLPQISNLMTGVRFPLPAPILGEEMSRWIFFICAITALFLLTSAVVELQWIGWSISSVSYIAWAYFAYKDKDTPRFLMELTYFGAALWGIYNWIGRN